MTDNNDFTHEIVIYNSDENNGTMGTGKFLLYDNNINALKVEDVSNLQIGGGENGQVLMTDGEGNLTWATSSGGGGVAVNADWNSGSGASRILNKPDLSVYLPKSGGTLTGKLNAAQGSGTTGGYSFGGTEGGNDTGMFSNADGVLDFYANAVKIVTVTTSGVTSTQAITLPGNPTSNLQAATKQYVDSSVSALNNFSGDYTDLTNKPTIATGTYIGTTQIAFNRASGAITLTGVSIDGNAATVSNGVYTTGTYANPAWITSLAYSKLTGAPTLATVATSGAYADLTGKPSLATVATSGSYSDLTNRPTIFSGAYADLTGKPTLFDGAYLSLTGLPNLAAVATSGSYNDLSNKPSIPDLTGYATQSWVQSQGYGSGSFTGSYNDLTNKPTLFSGNYNDLTNKPSIPTVPTNVSAFTNDSGYITNSALSGYATQSWVNSQGYGSGSGGQTFDQNLNTTDNVTFTGITLDGNITSSNGSEFITQNGSGGSIDIYTDWTGNGVEVWLQHGDRVAIKTENGTYAWDFDNAGKLTLPELGQGLGWINSDSAPTPDTGFLYSSTISFDKTQGIVLTNNVAGTDISWVIGKDGKLKLPAGGDIVDSNGNSVLGGGSGVSLPADANGFLANDGTGTLSWASAPARLVSPNGDFEVSLDDTGAVVLSSYGVVKNPDHVNIVSDGWAQLQWVDTETLTNADPNATQGPTNWIYVDQSGIHVETNINSNIGDSTSRYDWLFDINGNLTMPVGGDIKDSNGNSVLGGSSGIPTYISSGLTAPGSAVVANDTNVSVNFSDGGSGKFVFNADELSTGASIVPQVDNTVDLGSPTNRFRHLYVAPGTIYLGDIKLTNLNGKLDAKKVVNPGAEDEYDDETDSDAFSPIRGSGGATALEGLDDVRLDGPSNGQVLTWNSSQEKWENQDPSGSGGGSGPTNEITNTDPEGPTYSVSVGTDGVVTMVTSRGNLEFGALPEPGGPTHFHIMRPAGQEGSSDLYFGDDYNYVKLPGSYGAGTLGVEIGAKDAGDGGQSVWRFGTDGNIHLPPGGNILDSNSNSVLGGGSGASNALTAGYYSVTLNSENGYLTTNYDGSDTSIIFPRENDLVIDSLAGSVVLSAGDSKEFYFTPAGNLQLPPGGNILDSTGTSVLGGGFTKAVVAGQNDILAAESGNELTLVAGDGIVITTNENDGTITIAAASNASPQYGYFSELVETSSSNRVNTQAVVMDSDGNSYISYVYWDDNQSKDISGMAKYDSTGEQLWAVNLASQNPDARELNIRSLEFATFDGDPALIAVGYYYDNNTNKDVAFMFYVNPVSGSVGEPLIDCELVAQSGMNVKDGVAGMDGNNNPYAVVIGETYDQTLVKTFTPLAGSTTDKLFVSWADFAASGVNAGEGVYYVDGGSQYGVTMNAISVSATTAGSSDPSWAGISITVSKTEAGNYAITGVNGWGYLVNSWSNPVTLTVPGSALGGADGTNDLTFDFSNVTFNNNSSNIQAAISNIMGTPPDGVYCPGWGGYDWSTQVGNTLNFNYQLNNQAYVARFGQTAAWTKNFGGGSYDRLNSVVVDGSGNVYAVGYVWNGSRGGLVIKYDIDGNQQWAVYINPENNTGNSLMSVDLLSDGNIITVDEDGVITKLNSGNGDILWQVQADTDPSWDGDFRGTATPDGDYIITNYEDNDYTQYVMRVSGSDGSSVWNKRITRTYGGDNGEVTSNDDGQYIDCNATHLAIAGRTEPPSGNSVGLVYSFPINGENTDGTYGQYVISSESMNWETLSTTSIAATVTNTDISVTVNSVSPTSGSTYVTTSTITPMGGAPVVEPTVISWTNPNENVWRIEEYNGGASVSYNGGDYDAKWFDIANHTSGNNDFRGAIIQYHAFTNQGTIIGTIHLANDYPQQEATHTEHLSGGSDLQFVTLWDCNNERNGQLFFKMTNGNSNNLMVQWTAKIFYGSEYNY